MAGPRALEMGIMYHIYHRGNNREPIFFEKKNYLYFLHLYVKYIEPIAYTFAYCLMNNHLHLMIRTKTEAEQEAYFLDQKTSEALESSEVKVEVWKPRSPSQQFSNLFNSYAKAMNKTYGRTGSLFENKFGRKVITSERYYHNLIIYIHRNPQLHGFVDDFRDWPWSSYGAIVSDQETRVQKTAVLEWFDNTNEFSHSHSREIDETNIAHLLPDDFL